MGQYIRVIKSLYRTTVYLTFASTHFAQLSRKSSLKVTEKHNQAKKENVQPSTKRPLSGEKATTPVLKRASENVLASPTPPKVS